MPARPTSAALILAFLAAVHEAQSARIVRYMASEPLSTPIETTRNRLSYLVRTGRIERVRYARYRCLPDRNAVNRQK